MPEVSPEMAEKVLSADLRNVIKKVGDGVPLSPAEREMMERYLAASAEMEDLAKARSAALLRRWATGGKLSKDERKEVDAHFTSEGKAGRAPRLVSDRYEHPLRIYAEKIWPGKNIDTGVRTLKRWVKTGKAVQDLPPFDTLHELARWYERHHRANNAPEYLRRFEDQASADDADAPPPAGEASQGDESAGVSPMFIDLDAEVTADDGLRKIRALANSTYEQLEIELKRGRTAAAKELRKEWQSLMATQRQWEKDIVKIQEGKGEVLRTRVVNSELVMIFTAISQSYYAATIKLIQRLAPEMPANEQHGLAIESRDGAFLHLKETRFEPAWTSARQS